MTLMPGFKFMVAPRFHVSGEWSSRLLIGSGVEVVNGVFVPRPEWRAPVAEELAMLLADESMHESSAATQNCVSLFRLPEHLGSDWWSLLESSAGVIGDGRLPGFDSFASDVTEFLAFKGLTLPEGARLSVVVTTADERSRNNGGVLGVSHTLAARPWADEASNYGPWGAINLGDEDSAVALINLSVGQMAEVLRGEFPDDPLPMTAGELAAHFLRSYPDYPAVLMTLAPGQGYRLPHRMTVLHGHHSDKSDSSVLLSIDCEPRG